MSDTPRNADLPMWEKALLTIEGATKALTRAQIPDDVSPAVYARIIHATTALGRSRQVAALGDDPRSVSRGVRHRAAVEREQPVDQPAADLRGDRPNIWGSPRRTRSIRMTRPRR